MKNTGKVVTVDDNLRSFDTDYCGPFQMYFYLSLFKLLKESVAARKESKKLDVKLIGELLNETFRAGKIRRTLLSCACRAPKLASRRT